MTDTEIDRIARKYTPASYGGFKPHSIRNMIEDALLEYKSLLDGRREPFGHIEKHCCDIELNHQRDEKGWFCEECGKPISNLPALDEWIERRIKIRFPETIDAKLNRQTYRRDLRDLAAELNKEREGL